MALKYADIVDNEFLVGGAYCSPIKPIDPVNMPAHYRFGKYEVIDVLMDWFPSDPLLWQVGKYIARSAHKGEELEDLLKAQNYLNRKIKQVRQEGENEQG